MLNSLIMLTFLASLSVNCFATSAYKYNALSSRLNLSYNTNNSIDLFKIGDYVASYGKIYVVSDLSFNKIMAQNIQTLMIFKFNPRSLSKETMSYQGISPGDEVILLSTDSKNGKVIKIFKDGSTIIRNTEDNKLVTGMRPKKRRILNSHFYSVGDQMIDAHHYIGTNLGEFEDDFILYDYKLNCTRGRCHPVGKKKAKKTAKIIRPPFTELNYKQWVLELAEELNRGQYTHMGNSKAQFVMSKVFFQDIFVHKLRDFMGQINDSDFFKLVKHLVWKKKNAAKAAFELKIKVKNELEIQSRVD